MVQVVKPKDNIGDGHNKRNHYTNVLLLLLVVVNNYLLVYNQLTRGIYNAVPQIVPFGDR
jgi:hypothetical protein